MSIMVLGDCVIDYYKNLDKSFVGGSGLNTAVNLMNNKMDVDIMGVIGNDSNGKRILEYLKKKNFNTENIIKESGETAIAYIDKKGDDYKIVKVDENIKTKYKLTTQDINLIKGYDIVHTNIYSHTLHLLPFLKENNKQISFDYSFKSTRKDIYQYEKYIDILFVNMASVREKDLNFFKNVNIKHIIITSGPAGFITINNGEIKFQESIGLPIKDSTGAGDRLINEFLIGLYNNDNVEDIITKAAEKAYQTCTQIGPGHA